VQNTLFRAQAWSEGNTHFNVLVKFFEYCNHPVKRETFKPGIANA
jgi:hypothetical protein